MVAIPRISISVSNSFRDRVGTVSPSPVVLELAAKTDESLGDQISANHLWRRLLNRFPASPSSAWARNRLGSAQIALHEELLGTHPWHPAALAAAEAQEPDAWSVRHTGAMHLARWGASWPGAQRRLLAACDDRSDQAPNQDQRQHLARGLAQLGLAAPANDCLRGSAPEPATALAIGRTLLWGDTQQQQQGRLLLLQLTQQAPRAKESEDAARLLSDALRPDVTILDGLPQEVEERSGAVAAAWVRLRDGDGASEVIRRWPDDPAIWQLQWDLAREALLEGRWLEAQKLLSLLSSGSMPQPLDARRLFWLGFSAEQSGATKTAEQQWRRLIDRHPPGYYRWRAMVRLGEAGPLDLKETGRNAAPPPVESWRPLHSANGLVNTLWRLGLKTTAWDHWRQGIDPTVLPAASEQLVEGRLRIATGDPWTGLGRLERLSLRWRHPSCLELQRLQRSRTPRLYSDLFDEAASPMRLSPELLFAVTQQESRFLPDVGSIAGAQGLMQLMPATAAEVAGRTLKNEDLHDPKLNIELGARYLRQLLDLWQNNPIPAIASYNAGPGAVSSWNSQELSEAPELWIERIPYPETRYYTKKVMDNLLRYSADRLETCEQSGGGEEGTKPDATQED